MQSGLINHKTKDLLLPPNMNNKICNYCNIMCDLIFYDKKKYLYKFRCPKCKNIFNLEMSSYNKKLSDKYKGMFDLYKTEIKKFVRKLKKRYGVTEIYLEKQLQQFDNLKLKYEFLYKVNMYMERLDYLEKWELMK